MIYLVPGRQNLSIISLFPTASQERLAYSMPFLLKFNVVCEDQKEGGRGSVTPPPLKNPNLSNLHVKITLPPLLRKLDFSPLPLENGF